MTVFLSVLLIGLWSSVIVIMLVKTLLYLEEGSHNADAKIKAVLLGVGSLVCFAIGISTAQYNPATKITMPVKF